MPKEPWRESLYDDDSGGWRRTLRRVFGDGENPLRWGFPLFETAGIRVRVHVLFVFYIVAECIRALTPDNPGLMYVVPLLAALFLLVLLHELGHCVACRRVGGEADEILMWPLGGLATCAPPRRWTAHFWTTAGGPLVNAALLVPLAAGAYLVSGNWAAVIFNPFDPGGTAGLITASTNAAKIGKLFVWSLHYANMVLLAFNVLVPMYPMDGGRLLQSALWAKIGERESMRAAGVVGLVTAGALAVFAVVFGQMTLLAIAVLGGLVCYGELQRLRFEAADDAGLYAAALHPDPEPRGPGRAEQKRLQREQDERAEVDRVLDKINRSGIGSLTRKERAVLKRASSNRN